MENLVLRFFIAKNFCHHEKISRFCRKRFFDDRINVQDTRTFFRLCQIGGKHHEMVGRNY